MLTGQRQLTSSIGDHFIQKSLEGVFDEVIFDV
jgi:hypothetical protein